jgi:hypothetical protein
MKEKEMDATTVAAGPILHNGLYTIQNRKTGEHRTFRVKTQKPDAPFAPGQRVIGLLTGSDNSERSGDYTGFGFVSDAGVAVWAKKRGDGTTKTAWEWYAEMVWTLGVDGGASPFAEQYTLEMSGQCVRCNRTLTTPESIRNGIGPICEGISD